MCTSVCTGKPRKGTTSYGQMARSRMGACRWMRILLCMLYTHRIFVQWISAWYTYSIFLPFLHWWDFENEFTASLNGANLKEKPICVFVAIWSMRIQVFVSFDVESITRPHGRISNTSGAKTFRSKIHINARLLFSNNSIDIIIHSTYIFRI